MDVTPEPLLIEAARLINACRRVGYKIALAESCTGGLITAALTEIAGASDVVERGFVTYSNAAKEALLGVPHDVIAKHGAVSEEIARAMAEGALKAAPVDLTIAVTGIAGPGGGSAEKPVGLVHLAVGARNRLTRHERHLFGPGDRHAIRLAAVAAALRMLAQSLP
jgi:nicotinamide-nucleotide amidase